MIFTAECGCRIQYPTKCMLSTLEGISDEPAKVISMCKEHQYDLLLIYLENFRTITYALIKRVFKATEPEVAELLDRIEREQNNVTIVIHDYVVTRL